MKAFHSFFQYIQNARFMDRESLQSVVNLLMSTDPASFYDTDIPTYNEESEEIVQNLHKLMNDQDPNINITRNFSDSEIPVNTIAYHRIFGTILADDGWSWYFSTKQFMRDVIAAERNPQISAHFIHASTGGGEAWLLDKAFELLHTKRKKPVYAFVEKCACSAGYYLISPSDVVKCYTQNDTIGSIGTMIYMLNIIPALEKLGVQEVEEYAHKSTLKNKKFNGLLEGGKNAEKYITEELDPLQAQFEANVRSVRSALAKLKEDHPIFAGETYSGILASQNGLIDGLTEIEDALKECYDMGKDYSDKNAAQNKALNIYNS